MDIVFLKENNPSAFWRFSNRKKFSLWILRVFLASSKGNVAYKEFNVEAVFGVNDSPDFQRLQWTYLSLFLLNKCTKLSYNELSKTHFDYQCVLRNFNQFTQENVGHAGQTSIISLWLTETIYGPGITIKIGKHQLWVFRETWYASDNSTSLWKMYGNCMPPYSIL